MIREKTINKAVKPYFQEATIQIILDILALALVSTVLAFARVPLILCIVIDAGYIGVALIFHYKTVILALIDIRKSDIITETLSIKEFINEFSFAGDRLGRSNIRFFYPAKMAVWKYKIKTIDVQGKEKKLRTVMSFRKFLEFISLEKQQINCLNVAYLMRSKILIEVNLVNEADKNMNRRKRESINKKIRYINTSI